MASRAAKERCDKGFGADPRYPHSRRYLRLPHERPGDPKERVEPEQRNKKILDGVRAATFKPLIECLKSIDQDLLKGAIAGEKFSELFFASCKDEELAAYIKSLLA